MKSNPVFDTIHGYHFSVIGMFLSVVVVSGGKVRHFRAGFICTRDSQEMTRAGNLPLQLLCNFISLIRASLFTVHPLQPYQCCFKFQHFHLLLSLH